MRRRWRERVKESEWGDGAIEGDEKEMEMEGGIGERRREGDREWVGRWRDRGRWDEKEMEMEGGERRREGERVSGELER
jgi:hypothetical protein